MSGSLTFDVRESKDLVFVTLCGRMTLGPHLRAFSDRLESLIASRAGLALLLDVHEISELDSAGLGELVILLTACDERHWRMCLIGPSERLLGILDSTRLLDLFPHFPDRQTAEEWLLGQS